MKSTLALIAVCLATTQAFVATTPSTHRLAALNAYVPAGLSAAEYKRIKEADQKKMGNNLGGLGPRGFKSRSMQSWQEAYERGETGHSIAPFGYREALKKARSKSKMSRTWCAAAPGTTATSLEPRESGGCHLTKNMPVVASGRNKA
ncbi:hypothetical protein MHU86_20061 [Fragilaria crotonensis]|nr:hypothetical protein MHU86_20061 [Fragilaria crotonensis]